MMGSKKKHEHSKSRKSERKKHKHKKHKKKKEKTNVSDVSDVQENSDFEATASTEEALEQYDQILLALQAKKDKLKNEIPWTAETAADVSVSTAHSEQMDVEDASTSSNIKKTDKQPCSDDENPSGNENKSQSKEDSRSGDSQVLDKSQTTKIQSSSKKHKSKSKDHQSKSKSYSNSRGHRSRSRDSQLRSRKHRSRSRNHQSRSRDHRSRSRDHRSRNEGHHRSHRSRSRDHHTRRHSKSSSRERSRSCDHRKRHYNCKRRGRSSSSYSSRSSRSRSPRRRPKLIIEKAEPQLGSLESFTTLCQQLVTAQEMPVVNFPIDDSGNTIAEQQTRAPFNIGTANTQNLVFHNNAWKTSMQVMTEKAVTSSVAEIFPCSTGTDHRVKETQVVVERIIENPATAPQEPIDIGALSQRRLQLQQQLQANPMDIQAYSSYLQVEQQIAEWSNAQKIPGQFTGQKRATGLLGKDLHASGRQAWVKKDMFAGLNPVRSDFGLKMMKKMGWVEGTPLGKGGVGHVVPPLLSFQVDRKGLVSDIEHVKVAPPPSAIKSVSRNTPFMFKGKHPVSALQELAAKKQWIVSYDDVTIPDKPGFCFKITLPLGTFQPTEPSATKKLAKLHAALNCLVGIGALPAEEAKSILAESSN